MEAVQGLLKGSSWTQNGVSAAQLSGNMYLSVWKGAETGEEELCGVLNDEEKGSRELGYFQ